MVTERLLAEIRVDLDGVLPLVLPLIAAWAARPLSERLPPRTATWVLTAVATGLAVTGAIALAVPVLGGALRLPDVAALGHLSPRTLRHAELSNGLLACTSGMVLAASLGAAMCAALRQARALLGARRAARALPGAGVLAVIDDDSVEAFALPGRPGRVVVSAGMLAVLDPAERRALLAHEHAHLDGHHHLFRAAVRVAVAANPLLWPLKQAIGYTTERWADEHAAAVVGDRRRAAQAIGKAALAHGRRPGPRHAGALGIGSAPAWMASWAGPAGRGWVRTGPVPRRVAALLRPAPPRRAGLAVVTVALLLTSVVAVHDGAADLHQLIEHAQVHRLGRSG
jgi:Zn-dependent protease with chaperone function